MASFLTLPRELQLYIGQFLTAKEYYLFITSCRALWALFCDLVASRKNRRGYWRFSLDQDSWEQNGRIRGLHITPVLLDLVTTIFLEGPGIPLIDPLRLVYNKSLPPLSTAELNTVLLEVAETSPERRLAIFDQLKKHGCPKTFLPLFAPNMEFLLFTTGNGVRQMISQVCSPLQGRLHLAFPKLSHIKIARQYDAGRMATLSEIKALAQIPTIRSIQCVGLNGAMDRGEFIHLPVKELELLDTCVKSQEAWRDFFKCTTALERLYYAHGPDHSHRDSSIHASHVIINSLLGSASKSLTVLILEDYYREDYYRAHNSAPYAILKDFTSLKVLSCCLRDIIPDISCHDQQMAAEITVDQAIQSAFVVSSSQQTPRYDTLLADILPVGLKHLTLHRCHSSDLHHLLRFVKSEACQVETLHFEWDNSWDRDGINYYNLNNGLSDDLNSSSRKQSWKHSDAIKKAIRVKSISFTDECAAYTEETASDSWAEYQRPPREKYCRRC